MKLTYNPLVEEQVALLSIRREIAEKFPGSQIEISQPTMRSDYTYVEAQIKLKDGRSTSLCRGMTISAGTSLQRALNAEIVALVMCLNELGVNVEYEGLAKTLTTPKIDRINELQVFDKEAMLQCETVADVISVMNSLGLDTAPLEILKREMNRQGKRLTKQMIAQKLFGKREKFVVSVEKEPVVKQEPKKVEVEKAKVPVPTQAIRTSGEASMVLQELAALGIGEAQIKEKTSYGDMYSFAMSARQEEVDTLIDLCKS